MRLFNHNLYLVIGWNRVASIWFVSLVILINFPIGMSYCTHYFFKVNTASNKYHMLHVIAKILTCFELNIINGLLHVNFSFY